MSDQAANYNSHQQENLVVVLREDYQRFPEEQTFEIYAEDVYFKDPLNEFRGVKQYQKMIKFLTKFFSNIEMEVHAVEQNENSIKTEWTLNMNSPLPWKPRLSIPGRSELTVNEQNLISSHIDYWHISPVSVFSQNFSVGK